MRQRTLPYANRREQDAAPQAADPQVGHKMRPVALRTADPARRRAARFPRPGISPGAEGAEGGKSGPRVPQGAFCDQLAVAPLPPRRRAASGRVRVNAGLAERRATPRRAVSGAGPRRRGFARRADLAYANPGSAESNQGDGRRRGPVGGEAGWRGEARRHAGRQGRQRANRARRARRRARRGRDARRRTRRRLEGGLDGPCKTRRF